MSEKKQKTHEERMNELREFGYGLLSFIFPLLFFVIPLVLFFSYPMPEIFNGDYSDFFLYAGIFFTFTSYSLLYFHSSRGTYFVFLLGMICFIIGFLLFSFYYMNPFMGYLAITSGIALFMDIYLHIFTNDRE